MAQLDDITPREFWMRIGQVLILIVVSIVILWVGATYIRHNSNRTGKYGATDISQSVPTVQSKVISKGSISNNAQIPSKIAPGSVPTTTTSALSSAILPHFEELLSGQPSVGIASPDNGCSITSFSIYNMTAHDQVVIVWADGQKFGPFVTPPNTLQSLTLSGKVTELRIETDQAVRLADVDYRQAACPAGRQPLILSEPYIESIQPVEPSVEAPQSA
ncbi:MAG: hypothetical protein WCI47_02810 [bacterium]